MDESILLYVKRRLEESRGEWPQISKDTGVPYFTVTNIAQGKVEDPRISTMQKLYNHLKASDPAEARAA